MRLKIRKTASGTYYIPSLSIKQLRKLTKKQKRHWTLSKNNKKKIKKLKPWRNPWKILLIHINVTVSQTSSR